MSAGVALHIPMFLDARHMHYQLRGTGVDDSMMAGMVLIVAGLAATSYGLLPTRSALARRPIGPARPGSRRGIGGTVLGSLLWGWLGDRIGRRASILAAGVVFVATSICGAMPSYGWNLFMCFLMGLAAGGMLPIAFALLAEDHARPAPPDPQPLHPRVAPLPPGQRARRRSREGHGPLRLCCGGHRTAWWRPGRRWPVRVRHLIEPPFTALTASVALFGIAYGLVNYGFVLWLPTNLRRLGLGVGPSDRLLADSAILGLPATFAVAFAYGFWSAKKTMVAVAAVTGAALLAFAAMGNGVIHHRAVMETLIVVLLVGASSVIAVLTVPKSVSSVTSGRGQASEAPVAGWR